MCLIPYNGKLWRTVTVADLANYHKFSKISSAKIPCLILNNIIIVHIPKGLAMSSKLMCFVVNSLSLHHQSFPLYRIFQTYVCQYTHVLIHTCFKLDLWYNQHLGYTTEYHIWVNKKHFYIVCMQSRTQHINVHSQ